MRPILLAVGALAVAFVPAATGQETNPTEFEVHEIGYLDLNRKQTVKGWLGSVPRSTPMQATEVMAMWRDDTEWRDTPVPPTPRDPALLFYATRPLVAQVTVGFRGGAPVAWWPSAVPNGRQLHFANVQVNPALHPARPEALDTVKYPGLAPLRHVREAGATPVRVNNRTEGGLVYEGMLPFNPRLTVRQLRREGFEVRNDTPDTMHDVILIPGGERERGYLVGDMAPGTRFWIRLADTEAHPVADLIDLHLRRTGLFPKEIVALRKTLLSADFVLDPGVRLLARLPRAAWDACFPLTIQPAPRQIVRVGVVRLFDAAGYRPVTTANPVDPADVPQRGETPASEPVPTPPGTAGAR